MVQPRYLSPAGRGRIALARSGSGGSALRVVAPSPGMGARRPFRPLPCGERWICWLDLSETRCSPMGAKHFGARVARLEDKPLLTGQANFVSDIRLPGMLHACFVRSPHAHARIHRIDASAARAMPAGHAVLTAQDLPG